MEFAGLGLNRPGIGQDGTTPDRAGCVVVFQAEQRKLFQEIESLVLVDLGIEDAEAIAGWESFLGLLPSVDDGVPPLGLDGGHQELGGDSVTHYG
jgi:hypothetical protein